MIFSRIFSLAVRLLVLMALSSTAMTVAVAAEEVLELGGRRELFVDDYLIARRSGLELRLHTPVRREVVMIRDAPWEGSGSDFETIIRDGDIIRMYYIGAKLTTENGTKLTKPIIARACYAESKDGIHWTRPDLGLFDYEGSKQNNILWAEQGLDNFTPFKDSNPACPPEERYKALSGQLNKLFALKSADGIHWTRLVEAPIIDKGAFDTMNNAFWDPLRKQYFCYSRGYHDQGGKDFLDAVKGIRDIRVSTSPDFRTWTAPQLVDFVKSPDEGLYTNQVQPYYRAPQVLLGFPLRYIDRIAQRASLMALPDAAHRQRRMGFSPRYGSVVTDLQFMTSRDGLTFNRWGEALLRPGPERDNNWVYGDCLKGLGLLETPADDPGAAPELSFYVTEGHWKDASPLRRYTMRVDGFVSLQAGQAGGEFVSKPLRFSGGKLSLNFATSAAGSVRVELQDVDGHPLPGYSLAECDELFGDTLDRAVSWSGGAEIKVPATAQPVRLRMVLREADVYSLQFVP